MVARTAIRTGNQHINPDSTLGLYMRRPLGKQAKQTQTKPSKAKPEKPTIVFFEQPSIPGHPLQRRFLCEQIKGLAEAWPDHPVIFKPRTSSIESTLHRRHGEMASLIDKMTTDQPNLRLSFKPWEANASRSFQSVRGMRRRWLKYFWSFEPSARMFFKPSV